MPVEASRIFQVVWKMESYIFNVVLIGRKDPILWQKYLLGCGDTGGIASCGGGTKTILTIVLGKFCTDLDASKQ